MLGSAKTLGLFPKFRQWTEGRFDHTIHVGTHEHLLLLPKRPSSSGSSLVPLRCPPSPSLINYHLRLWLVNAPANSVTAWRVPSKSLVPSRAIRDDGFVRA